jgi:atlastin
LEILHIFTEYGREALKFCKSVEKRPFQRLILLVRDWKFFKDQEFGANGFDKLIEKYFDDTKLNKTAQFIRNQIKICLESVSGFLMPDPGSEVSSGTFTKLSDFDDLFYTHLKDFISNLFDMNKIKPKEINGNPIKGKDICQYFANFYYALSDKDLPSPVSMITATIHTSNLLAQTKAFQTYDSLISKNSNVLDGKDLKEHDKSMRVALKEFIAYPKYGSLEDSNKFMENLMNQIWSRFNSIDKHSKEGRSRAKISAVL